jgi:moderate conductance mechanosensitive channel
VTFNELARQAAMLKVWQVVLLKTGGIILAAWVLLRIGYTLIDRLAGRLRAAAVYTVEEKRVATLATLARSVVRYALNFIAATTVLSAFGINTASILAGAGIVGLAVGFGAQSLVRDVITGFFLILENQFSVGEYLTAGGVSGIVEEIGLRTTRLRDFSGELHTIPNGEIKITTNHSRGSIRAVVDVAVPYEEDLSRVLQVLQQVADEARLDLKERLREGPEILGVHSLGPSDMVVRITARTAPLGQWALERELRRRIKEAFDREAIEIAHSRQVLVASEGRRHQLPPPLSPGEETRLRL